MFLLSKEEKIAFMKAVYSVMMFDRQIHDQENKILYALKNEVFNLSDFQKIDLEKDENIIAEINKINSIIPVIYLFNILYELEKYFTKNKSDYLSRIDNILSKTKMRDEILKSKLFKFNERKKYIIKEKEYENNSKEKSLKKKDQKVENKHSIEETIKKFTSLFTKG